MASKSDNRKSQGRYLYPASLLKVSSDESYEKDRLFMDWLRVRQVLEHEDYLLIERAKLLLAVQTILSALIYFVLNSSYNSVVLPCSLCVFGMLMSLHLTVGMYKAKNHQNKIINWWFSRVGWTSRKEHAGFWSPVIRFVYIFRFQFRKKRPSEKDLPDELRLQPPVAGKDPGIVKYNWSLPYWGIGGMFCIIWAAAFIAFASGMDIVPSKP